MNILLLEDNPDRVAWFKKQLDDHTLTVVETARKAIRLLSAVKYDLIFLDHDLGGMAFVNVNNRNTGSEVARQMHLGVNQATDIVVHSHNPAGADNIISTLNSNGHRGVIRRLPFGSFSVK